MGHATNRHALRSMGGLTAVVVLLLVMMAPAAQAQYPPPRALGLVCTPEDGLNPGQTVACKVIGALRDEPLRARARFNPVVFDQQLVADQEGEADFAFEAPDTRGAVITVSVTGTESGDVATARVLVLPAQASDRARDAAPGRGLARTGFETFGLLLSGVLLIALGGSAVAASRRRDRRRVDA